MAEIGLQRPGIDPVIRQLVTGGVAQHQPHTAFVPRESTHLDFFHRHSKPELQASAAARPVCLWCFKRIGDLFQLHGDLLDCQGVQPSFRLSGHPNRRRHVILEGIDALESAVRPLGFDRPFIAVAEDDVKDWLFC